MNTMKKNGGFTLVELIIVIAILAILSTGAIAGYSAYIKSANNAAVKAVLSDIYTAAVLANAETGSVTVTVSEKTVDNAKVLEVKVSGVGTKFESLFEGSLSVGDKSTTNVAAENNVDVYTGNMTLPSAWANSDYSGLTNVSLPIAG